jgi:hypothetical protein
MCACSDAFVLRATPFPMSAALSRRAPLGPALKNLNASPRTPDLGIGTYLRYLANRISYRIFPINRRIVFLSRMDHLDTIADRDARIILVAICRENPIVLQRATDILSVIKGPQFRNRKRKSLHEELSVCEQCDEGYFESENHPTACLYHEGSPDCSPPPLC